MKKYTNEDFLKDIHEGKQVLPLMTTRSMAARWGKPTDFVYNRFRRDNSFPVPLEGIVLGLTHEQKVFPFYEVERYEKENGLNKKGEIE